ncbi:uncharacterized protein LOC6550000 [Drosophila erecta]|uniref:Ashwin n=1 Tax=Drosophila erecta TaxID=7220 RepID=B3NVK1_DROER|nr:uncharacterized protein LOC6550000 [Drosophila erecta]EDV46393.1 uncharacterized protein Dere_GG19063 [Drosophila erecta]
MDQDLSRADMLEHLKNRQIYLPDAEHLPMDRLEEIYRKFVVPKPRREPRDRSNPNRPLKPNPNPIPMEMEQLAQRIKSVAMVGQKRPLAKNASDDRAKQIKMDLR